MFFVAPPTARRAVRACRNSSRCDFVCFDRRRANRCLCFWQAGQHAWLLIIAPLFCYVRLWCNMLDGMVALASGKASWRGEILNDLPDRVSDVVIFVGVAHSGLMHPLLGYWAAIFALLTAYVGMFGQAVGVQREFSGMMSKPWRMVALHVGAWIDARLSLVERRRDSIRRLNDSRLDLPYCRRRLCANDRRSACNESWRRCEQKSAAH